MAYIKKADQLKILIVEDMSSRIEFFKNKFKGHDLYFFDNAKDSIDALKLISDKPWDVVFLDHDLGGRVFVSSSDPNTGYAVAEFIRDNDIKINQIIIHSMNPAGSQNIKSVLPQAKIIPFTLLKTSI